MIESDDAESRLLFIKLFAKSLNMSFHQKERYERKNKIKEELQKTVWFKTHRETKIRLRSKK